jgi:hypothetical protein
MRGDLKTSLTVLLAAILVALLAQGALYPL